MRIPYSIQGVLFVPAFVGLIFVLKAMCPVSAGSMCFADQFAVPIFLPLIAIYKIFGGEPMGVGQELLFIILYWGLVGFLLGFIVDLFARKRVQHTEALHPVMSQPPRPLVSIATTPQFKAPQMPSPQPPKPPVQSVVQPVYTQPKAPQVVPPPPPLQPLAPVQVPSLQAKPSTFYSSQEPMPKPSVNPLDIKEKPPF